MSVVSNGSSVKSSEVLVGEVLRGRERLRRERVVRVHHDHQLVLEQLVVDEAGVRLAPNADRDVQRLLAQRPERVADRRRNDAELDAGASLAKRLEDGREPVIRGVALRAESQQLAAPDHAARRSRCARARSRAAPSARFGAVGRRPPWGRAREGAARTARRRRSSRARGARGSAPAARR